MSLYIGKDNTNVGILEVTTAATSVAEFKAGTALTSIFSTKLPFLECEVFELTNIIYTSNSYFSSVVTAKLSNACIDYINNKTTSTHVPLILYSINNKLLFSDGRINNNSMHIWNFTNTSNLVAGQTPPISIYPTYTYSYKHLNAGEVNVSATPSTVKALIFNINLPKNISTDIVTRTPIDYGNRQISIGNNYINIGPVDITKLHLVTRKPGSNGTVQNFANGNYGLSIMNKGSVATSYNFYAFNNRIYLKNSLNEYIFDTDLSYMHIKVFNAVPIFSAWTGTSRYITNMVADGTAAIFTTRTVFNNTYTMENSPFSFSCLLQHSSTPVPLYYVQTGPATGFRIDVWVANINNIPRYHIGAVLVYQGGGPIAPLRSDQIPRALSIIQLYE